MNTSLLDAAIDLLEKQEFSVIPLRRDKKPLLAWQEFQGRKPSEEEVEQWFTRWPDANIGIVTGAVSGLVVVDADGAEGLTWMKEHLPVTSVYVQTGKGYHAYFRHPGGHIANATRIAPEVDIRADGGYVVAPPSVHDNGTVYSWLFTPGLGGWDGLATYPTGLIGIDLSAAKPLVSTAPVEEGSRNTTLTALVGKWIQSGMDAEAVAFASEGWNNRLEKPLPISEIRRTVESIIKKDHGNHPEKYAGEDVDLVEVKAKEEKQQEELPESLLHPGGYLEQVMNYIDQSSPVYHPTFALAAALPLLGTLIGQKVCTETGLRTNIYCVGIGLSGAGKNDPQGAIQNILTTSRASSCWAGNEFTSDAALLKHLSTEGNARALAVFDEMGLLLKALSNPNSAAYTLPHTLMRLYSSYARGYRKTYADERNVIDLKWHHLSFLGFSTPVRFWEAVTTESAKDGFLARCDIFDSRVKGKQKSAVIDAIPDDLLAATNAFADIQPEILSRGNLINIPKPRVIAKSPEAAEFFQRFADKYAALMEECQENDEARASIYNRVAERASKIALIHAVSLQGIHIHSVTIDSVLWACQLVERLTQRTIASMAANLADSEYHKLMLRAMKIITANAAKNKSNACPRWEFIRNIHIPAKQAQELIDTLKAGGYVLESMQAKRGKSAPCYAPARPLEEV